MSYFKAVCGATLLLALLLVGVKLFSDSAGATTSVKPIPASPVHQSFQVSQTYVSGNPAIHPHLLQNGSGPAFTRDDVTAFFNTYGFYAGPVVAGAHLKILTIQFVTSQQASQLMRGESVGRPDNALVCYVKVEGPFLLTNVRGGPPRASTKQAPTTAKYGDAVFDAHTGNLLVWGVYF